MKLLNIFLWALIATVSLGCGGGSGSSPSSKGNYGSNTSTILLAPSSLSAKSTTQTQVSLSWLDNSNNETGFRLERKPGSFGAYSEIAVTSANVSSYNDTSVVETKNYTYRIRAYNSTENSIYSNTVTTTIPGVSPNSPSNLSSTTFSASQINISWLDNSTNELGFYLDRKTGVTGSYSRIATLGTDVNSYSDLYLNEQQTYFYRLRSYNLTGMSNYSNETNATTLSSATAGLWSRTYSGPGNSRVYSVINTSDGGFLMAGALNLNSSGAINDDVWLIKLKSDETIDWQKTYGGSTKDVANMVQQTTDGGYIVAGESASFNSGSANSDVWVLKLNSLGEIVWEKRYGFGPAERAEAIVQTDDNADGVRDDGFILVGFSASLNGLWVIKLNSVGDVSWQQLHTAGLGSAFGYSVQQTADAGFIITGEVYNSISGNRDLWVIKLASDGTMSWQKTYAGADNSAGKSIIQTDDNNDGVNDDGYIVVGYADTDNTSVINNAVWVLKLASDGSITWQKTFLGAGAEAAYDVIQTSDNGFLVAGTTTSFGASSNDFWLIHLLADGSVNWEKRYGGLGGETAYSVQEATDNGFIVVGSSGSFTAGKTDIWALRLDATTNINFKTATNGSSQATSAAITNTTTVPQTRTRVADTTSLAGNGATTSATVQVTTAIVKTQSQ